MKICRSRSCNTEFKNRAHNHYFCCEKCKYTHHNHTETHRAGMKIFNKSEKGKARTVKYLSTEKGKKYNKDKSSRYRVSNPDKINAVHMANKHLPNKSCQIEGCDKTGEKHHPDYHKPLIVEYLCKHHHMQHHHPSTEA